MTTPQAVADLVPDARNRRTHTPRNVSMIVDSLQKVGASRSIVIDEHNEILAGNGVVEAAAQAGLTKLHVIDVDGDTIVAVRRHGLTDDQKRDLAIYDNRTAELAEWNLDQLRDDAAHGLDLEAFDFDVNIVGAVVDEAPAPDLPDGQRAPFQQMTFTLHNDQVAIVKAAVAKAIAAGCDSTTNANSNGNALAAICEVFLRG